MKRLLVILCLSIFMLALTGTFTNAKSKNPWRKGKVVLFSGDTLHCQLKFTRKVSEGLLQIQNGKQIEILTVKDVSAFSYFDEEKKQFRKFITLALKPELSTRTHEIFIEYVYGNKRLSILNHKTLGFAANSLQINPFRKKTVVNKRYILNNNTGEVLPMSRENVLIFMESERRDVITFIQSKGLRLKTVNDFISLLEFHQSLL